MTLSPIKNTIKCVIVGSCRTGKTCLVTSYTKNKFSTEYIPTVFELYSTVTMIDAVHYKIDISDSTGDPEYDRLRPLDYNGTHVFIVCFSVVSPESFVDVKQKWIPEIRAHCEKPLFILVGTKTDLRNDPRTLSLLFKSQQMPIRKEQGLACCKEVGGAAYVECSAVKQKGIHNVFDEACRAALGKPETPGIRCKIC